MSDWSDLAGCLEFIDWAVRLYRSWWGRFLLLALLASLVWWLFG